MRIESRRLFATALSAALLAFGAECSSSDTSEPVPVATITITPPSGSVDVGSTLALVIALADAKGKPISGRPITFTSSDTNMATVSESGVVSGVAPGSVFITAVSGDKAAQAPITVMAVRDDWITYGHDARRTGASLGSVTGPLTLAWSYVPQGTSGHALNYVQSAIATVDAIYVRTSLNAGYGYGLSPAADRVSPAGQHVWTYNMGTDADFGDWGSLMGDNYVINSDGTRYVNVTSGAAVRSNGVDSWGEILTDATTVYQSNDVQIDGPGVHLAALDSTLKARWTSNAFASCRGSASAMAGGLALNNGVVFYAPAYNVGKPATQLPFASGVFAFDASTGAKLAYHASTPYSRLSADDSRVYLVENTNKLVALAQSDLHVAWTATVTNPGEQAPVVANGLVIIGTASDVEAYDASTGAKRWSSAAMNGAAAHWSSTYQGGNCGAVQIPAAYGGTATMAAALGSRTLVVTAFDGIHILALGTGVDVWHGRPSGIAGNVSNPVIVNDPAKGAVVYVEDYGKLYALSVPAVPAVLGNARAGLASTTAARKP
jgi:hypothetical protein